MKVGRPDWVLVLEYIRSSQSPVTSAQIAKGLGICDRRVSGALVRLHCEGRIEKVDSHRGKAIWAIRRLNL